MDSNNLECCSSVLEDFKCVAILGYCHWSLQWHAWLCAHPSSTEVHLFLCSGAAFPLYAGLEASGRGFGGDYNPLSAWIALLLKSIK